MADKRAMDRKWVAEPYDMDTALGINNSGILSYGYSLQDTDQVDAEIAGGDDQGSKDVFNAQNSVLWMNIRDAYRDQIVSMYQSLRSGDKFNYSYIEQYFENHQSKWPEALVNEDSYVKYITPLVKPVTEKKDEVTGETYYVTTSEYLTKLLGLKTQQRRRWMYNRFRFTDSKYLLGDAAANTIGMRLFHDGTLTVTPALDLYVSVRFGLGSTPRQVQTTAGTPIDFAFVNPSGTKDMETVIYSADLITDLGDLSVFYPNEINLSFATRLRRLKIGSGEEGYSNGRLNTINISNKPVLEYLDLRNCPNLAEGFDLEGSPRLEEAYFDGTAITGVDLAEGCSIEHLHLPDTITALTLMDLDKLTDLQLAGLSKVERCMIRNVSPSVADPISIVEQLQPGTLVYLEGINVELADAAAIDEFMDVLDTMKGVTRTRGFNGRWAYTETEKAQVSGTIHTTTLTGAEIAAFKKRYPYISVTADHVEAVINFKSHDGSITYETKTIINGADATYTGSTTPTKESTPQYNYTFANSWSLTPDGNSDANALKAVWDNRDVYACFDAIVRSYNVRYMNEGTQVGSTQVVQYGGNATPPADPTHPTDASRYVFQRWEPTGENITGDTDCIAKYKDTALKTLLYLNNTITDIVEPDGYTITYVRPDAFRGLKTNATVDLKNVTSIGEASFQDCRLYEINLPNLITVGASAFSNASVRHQWLIEFEYVKTIESYAFQKFYAAVSADNLVMRFPAVETVGNYAFYGARIKTLELGNANEIGSRAFVSAAASDYIHYLIIRSNQVPNLPSNTINNKTSIYVPDQLVDSYKTATNWSTFGDNIYPISEVPE